MEDQTKLFIFASPEIKELLADNETDLVEVLQQKGYQISKAFAEDPTKDSYSGRKDITTVVVGSVAIIAAITPIISKILQMLSRKTIIVKEWVCIPVEDSKGNVVRDSAGEPKLQWVERARFLESNPMESSSNFTFKAPLGIELSFSDSPKKVLLGGNDSEEL